MPANPPTTLTGTPTRAESPPWPPDSPATSRSHRVANENRPSTVRNGGSGINTKALSTYMGHSSITITLDRYGHLLPGNETQAAHLLESWLRESIRQRQA